MRPRYEGSANRPGGWQEDAALQGCAHRELFEEPGLMRHPLPSQRGGRGGQRVAVGDGHHDGGADRDRAYALLPALAAAGIERPTDVQRTAFSAVMSGDDTVLLDTKDIIVLVPGSSY